MRNFIEADQKLTGRNHDSRKLENNTYLERRGENIAIRLHRTDIVTHYPDGSFSLNDGGWNTPTTAERIQAYAPTWARIHRPELESGWTGKRTAKGPDCWGVSHREGGPVVWLEAGERVSQADLRTYTETETADIERQKLETTSLHRAAGGWKSGGSFYGGEIHAVRQAKGFAVYFIPRNAAPVYIEDVPTLKPVRVMAGRLWAWQMEMDFSDLT